MTFRFPRLPARCLPLLACMVMGVAPLLAEETLTGGFSTRPEIEKRLAAVHQELTGADKVTSDSLQELESVCEYHLAAIDLANAAREDLGKARKAVQDWNGLPDQPPYSIRFVDDLREQQATLQSYNKATEAQIRIITSQLESARDELSNHQRAERSLNDKAAGTESSEALKQTQDSLSLEKINSRITAEEIGRLSLHLEAQRTEQEMIQTKLQLADLRLKAAEGKSSFTRNELDEILGNIASEKKTAARVMGASVHGPAAANPLLSWHIEFLALQQDFWQSRFDALNAKDPAIRKTSLVSYKQWSDRVQDWTELARLRLDTGTASTSVDLDPAQLRDALQEAQRLQRRIGFAIAELGGNDNSLTISLWDRLTSSVASVWEAELYLAEEEDIIDGKKVSTYRAITVGKIVRLALIMTVGWLLLRFISKRIHPIIARRPGISPGAAHLITRLFLGIGIALLVIYGLNTVHIPFTAFAFLGGALAIGVGFGTQTILKNFISGVILIFERPIKVGDIVEIGGVTGKVQSIGMRASRIDHFDGIDTLVPNSTLLENTLTNWSFSDTLLRYSITVGVAYGSNTRDVARILLAVADEHGLVLDKPSPEVRFSDFGDNSLVFNLLFWFDSNTTRRDPLASDLRFMIEKALTEVGIAISFPQRDLHFDPATPLRVELTRPRKAESES